MINILEVSCSSPVLGIVTQIVKKIVGLIQIIAPILLIISLIINIINLVQDPENKKLPKKIFNAIIATIVVFFIPLLVNVVMDTLGNSNSISACWNSGDVDVSVSQDQNYQNNNGENKKIITDTGKYEKGK